ncbi:hypothetical protein FDP41_005061 [Naegleria fowleri]|uniref:Uncharacterized protein n=1 Tax=Naegleria fowleri TaxID=5763 RepID=A0A6A5BNR7_NAEFO|nr:uncharacterized protein FDP41_005061 [Naegleria fowleri]KAF0975734.1 hypothetical protein FDP41_005061 [Naegleria fowleri]
MMIGSLTNSTTSTTTTTTNTTTTNASQPNTSKKQHLLMNGHSFNSNNNSLFDTIVQKQQQQQQQPFSTSKHCCNSSTPIGVKHSLPLHQNHPFMKTTSYSLSSTSVPGRATNPTLNTKTQKKHSLLISTNQSTRHSIPCHGTDTRSSNGTITSNSSSSCSTNGSHNSFYATPLSSSILRPSTQSRTRSSCNETTTTTTTTTPPSSKVYSTFSSDFTSCGYSCTTTTTRGKTSTPLKMNEKSPWKDIHSNTRILYGSVQSQRTFSPFCDDDDDDDHNDHHYSLSPPLSTSFVDKDHSLFNTNHRKSSKMNGSTRDNLSIVVPLLKQEQQQQKKKKDHTMVVVNTTTLPKLHLLEPFDEDLRILEEGFPNNLQKSNLLNTNGDLEEQLSHQQPPSSSSTTSTGQANHLNGSSSSSCGKTLSSTSTTSPLLYIQHNTHSSLFEDSHGVDEEQQQQASTLVAGAADSISMALNGDVAAVVVKPTTTTTTTHTSLMTDPNKDMHQCCSITTTTTTPISPVVEQHQHCSQEPHHETSTTSSHSACRTISEPQKNKNNIELPFESPQSIITTTTQALSESAIVDIQPDLWSQQQQQTSLDNKKRYIPSTQHYLDFGIEESNQGSPHPQHTGHPNIDHHSSLKVATTVCSEDCTDSCHPSTTRQALKKDQTTNTQRHSSNTSETMMKACMPSCHHGMVHPHLGNHHTVMGKQHHVAASCKKEESTRNGTSDCSNNQHTLEFVRVLLGQNKEAASALPQSKRNVTTATTTTTVTTSNASHIRPPPAYGHKKRSTKLNVLRYSYESDDEGGNAYDLSPLNSNSKIYYVDQILSSGDKDCYEQNKDVDHDEDEALQEWERTKQKYKNAFKRRTNVPNPNNNHLSRNYSGNMSENLRMVTEKVCHLQQVKIDLEEQTQEIQNIWESLVHEDLVWQVEDLIVQSALCCCGDLNSTKSIQTLFNMICETENEMVNALEDLIDFIFCSTRRSCKKHSINFNMILELVKDSSPACANILSKHQSHFASQTSVALNSQRYKLDQHASKQHTSLLNKKTLVGENTSQLQHQHPQHQKKNVTSISPHNSSQLTKHHALPAKMIPSSPQIQSNEKSKRHISLSELENKESFLQLLGIGKRKELLESIRSIVEVLLEVSSVVLHSNEDKIESLDNSFKEMISTYSKIISEIEDFAPRRLFNVF